ncbi:small ribosomal subunit protein S13, mitochondrial [Durio zibethinus]|uniref:Small ribosomal subunit protein S13, mitochondrial n=1 Tax=Durio zibethinus TaxID=66656 RepID=A0A6P6ATL2_DURZI|nr:small ribosomal subunit protein S13, mitochondrial [Durio zibethinus]XP_022768238.1 small ribosomal subunit protein S13, mitochondrial [Durio zibethinus]
MLGLRGSVGVISDISNRLVQTITFRGIKVQGIRVGGAEIPDHKRLAVSLQSIFGIGHNRARQILSELNIENKLTNELTARELVALREHVSNTYVIGEDLRRCVIADISRLKGLQCYRGIRHEDKLPCRGQRTKTNSRTAKKGLNAGREGHRAPRN